MAPLTIVWSDPALADFDDIAAFIALDDGDAASRMVERVIAAVERLRRYPRSGRAVPEVGGRTYREVVVPPCRIMYRIERRRVLVVHVMRPRGSCAAIG